MDSEISKVWDQAILIVPKEDQIYFLKEKEKNPSLSFHLFTKEEVLENYFGKIDSASFYLWYQHHPELSYVMAKIYFSKAKTLYKNAPIKKVQEVYQTREELEKMGCVLKKPYFSYFLHQKPIYAYGYENDAELEYLFQLENLAPKPITLIKKEKEKKVLEFETIEEEIVFTLQSILKLYEEGVPLNKIHVMMKGDEYTYPFYKLAKEFHVPTQPLFIEKSLYLEETQNVIRYYEANHSFDDFTSENEMEMKVKERIETFLATYDFSSFPFRTKLELIKEDLRSLSLEKEEYEDAIHWTSRHLFLDDEYVFILGFEQGKYPLIHQDDDYFPNAIKKEIHQNTSLQKNEYEEKRIFDLIFVNENVTISYKKKALDGLHHLSMLVEKWHLLLEPQKMPLISYSLSYTKRKYAEMLDFEKKYGVLLKERGHYSFLEPFLYRDYEHHFQGSNFFKEDAYFEHSYSSLKLYAQCPYHYYLERCLKLDPFVGNFYTKFGTLAHSVLEHNYEENADFDTIFMMKKSENEWDEKEEILLIRLQEELHVIWDFNLEHYQQMDHPLVALENTFVLPLHTRAKLVGKVDKLFVLKEDHSLSAIVDYKTGLEKFDPKFLPYGLSLQLPIYGLLLKGELRDTTNHLVFNPYQNTQMIGGYIQQILPSKAVTSSKKDPQKEKKYYTLNGWTLDEEQYILPFDPTFKQSKYIAGLKLTAKGFGKYAKVFSKEQWASYESLTKDLIMMMDNEIRSNHFPIRPKFINKTIKSCEFCPYKDICFVEEKDKEIIKTKGEDDNAEMDE